MISYAKEMIVQKFFHQRNQQLSLNPLLVQQIFKFENDEKKFAGIIFLLHLVCTNVHTYFLNCKNPVR